ncbi:MAG: hypothetical protein IKN57_05070, partial [Parasporobacterium sp.]|nr:hypothetical protein [Parasporobacterium sp.]
SSGALPDSSACSLTDQKKKPSGNAVSLPLHLRAALIPDSSRVIPCTDEALEYTGCWYDLSDTRSPMPEKWSNEAGSSVSCHFSGTGIVWYGPVDVNYGAADVFVDGARQPVTIDQKVDGVDFPGSAAGFDKKYHYPVFSVNGLPDGDHVLKIAVRGGQAEGPADRYTVIESFQVIRKDDKPRIRLHCLCSFNFPQLSWGNKKNPPVIMKAGDQMSVKIR